MSIIQVRSTSETQWLSAPFPPAPKAAEVIAQWLRRSMECEFFVYPPSYVGNISPVRWRETANFWLSVDDSGEQAELLVTTGLSEQKTPDEMRAKIAKLRDISPAEAAQLGTTDTVSEKNKTALLATALNSNSLAIGGLVLHADQQELAELRLLIPEAAL